MGLLDQFCKATFAEETRILTGGALRFEAAAEIGLSHLHADGLLVVDSHSEVLSTLPFPWCQAQGHDEILIELKMPGDHLDTRMLQRALLRRQARQVQRTEADGPQWEGEEPLWIIAPSIPEMLFRLRHVTPLAPGCYQVGPASFPFLWIAANELPLAEELVPFLVARSGRKLAEFARWVVWRRPSGWVATMVQILPMTTQVREEFFRYWPSKDDPEYAEFAARMRHATEVMLERHPDLKEEIKKEGLKEGLNEGVLEGERAVLLRLLRVRFGSLPEATAARIQSADRTTLETWAERVITASSLEEVFDRR